MTEKTVAEWFEWYQQIIRGHSLTPEECAVEIERQAQRLIEWLYDPEEEPGVGWRCSERVKELGFQDELINWGDLHVVEVQPSVDGSFLVIIEEAAPDCSEFQTWLANWLLTWGWHARVETEW